MNLPFLYKYYIMKYDFCNSLVHSFITVYNS
jgi:hypothetical protein